MPFGGDYLAFWSAAHLVLAGRLAEVYDAAAIEAVQQALFDHRLPRLNLSFLNPPVALLLFVPFGLLPYGASVVAFLGLSFLGYWQTLRRWLPQGWARLPVLVFPGAWIPVFYGQNGLVSAALLAGGAFHLGRRPVLAGILFGCLAYKPQLGLAVPVLLIAGGHRRALAAMAATGSGLVLLSALLFGPESWVAWLDRSAATRQALEGGAAGFERIVSTFSLLRMAGAGAWAAGLAQALVAATALLLLVRAVRRQPDAGAQGALLVACTPLVSPYLLDYDLAMLAMPLGWLVVQGLRSGFRPGEKLLLLLLFVMPMHGVQLAAASGVQFIPLLLIALFALVLSR